MKERKQYEVPNVTVISMDVNSDVIQTSGEEVIVPKLESLTNIANYTNANKAVNALESDISSLF